MNPDNGESPALADTLAAWRMLIDALPQAVWIVDGGAMRVVAANHAAAALLAVDLRELIGKPVLELAGTPEDVCFWGEVADGLAGPIESDTFVSRGPGDAVPVTRRISRIERPGGATLYVVALHDRSQQVRVERELECITADLRATLESTHDGILVTDLAGRIRNFNRRFAGLWAMPAELTTRHDDDAVFDWMRRSVVEPSAYMRRLAEIDVATSLTASDQIRLHSGTVLERVVTPQCMNGHPVGRVFSFRDITEQLAAHERIQRLSYYDALTGLPNRRLLTDRFEVSLAAARRDSTPFALLVLNLDRFNRVNEILGRVLGDRVLADVAGRIAGCMRDVDTVARLDGDEFAVLLNRADEHGAETAAKRLVEALQASFSQGGMSFTVTASIGLAPVPPDGASLDDLLRNGDAAMRGAKLAGRAGWRLHRPSDAGASDPAPPA